LFRGVNGGQFVALTALPQLESPMALRDGDYRGVVRVVREVVVTMSGSLRYALRYRYARSVALRSVIPVHKLVTYSVNVCLSVCPVCALTFESLD